MLGNCYPTYMLPNIYDIQHMYPTYIPNIYMLCCPTHISVTQFRCCPTGTWYRYDMWPNIYGWLPNIADFWRYIYVVSHHIYVGYIYVGERIYVGRPQNHICWTTRMRPNLYMVWPNIYTSIHPTYMNAIQHISPNIYVHTCWGLTYMLGNIPWTAIIYMLDNTIYTLNIYVGCQLYMLCIHVGCL